MFTTHTWIVRVEVFFFAPTKIFIFVLWLFRTEVQESSITGLDLFGVLCFAFQNWLGIVLIDWNVFHGNNKRFCKCIRDCFVTVARNPGS